MNELEQCLFCNCDLSVDSTWSDEVSTILKNKLFDVFCKFLKIKDRGWDNFPVCSLCVCFLEEILSNYDLIQSVYDTITSIYKNVHNIMKESRNGDDYYNIDNEDRKMSARELKFFNFRENVYQRIQNFQDKSNSEENSIISLVEENSGRNEGEDEEQEEEEINDNGNYFSSFLHKNIQQLWGESIMSKRQEERQATRKRKLDTRAHYDSEDNPTDSEERREDYNDSCNDDGFQNDNDSSSDNDVSSGQEEGESSNNNDDDGGGGGGDIESDSGERRRSTRIRATRSSRHRLRLKSTSNTREPIKRGERRVAQLDDGNFTYRETFPIKKIEESNSYKCGKCQDEGEQVKSYDMICDVVEHIENDHLGAPLQIGLPAYFCHICGYILRGKNAAKHVFFLHETKKKIKRHRCRICAFFALNVEDLTAHVSENHPIIYEEALARHPAPAQSRIVVRETSDGKWMYRGVEIKAVTSEDGNEEIFQCALCPTKMYKTRIKASDHIRRNHIENAVEGRFTYEGVEIEMENGHYRCTLCPDRAPYRARRNLQTHILDNHKESDKPWMPCEECGKEYRTLTQLNIHRKIHKNRDILCDLCGKAFNSKVVLRTHVRHMHEGFVPEKKFECSQCNKKFVLKVQLLIHTRKHNGEFPFPCLSPECVKAFRSEKARRVHWRRRHAEDTPFKCNFCQQAFHDTTFVTEHLKQCHPEVKERRKGIGYQIIYKPKTIATKLSE